MAARHQTVYIAEIALLLASDESHFINGVVIASDGGWTTF